MVPDTNSLKKSCRPTLNPPDIPACLPVTSPATLSSMNEIKSFLNSLPRPPRRSVPWSLFQKSPLPGLTVRRSARVVYIQGTPAYHSFPGIFRIESTPEFPSLRHNSFSKSNPPFPTIPNPLRSRPIMRRGSKRHPKLANEEKNLNKLTSTPHTLKLQHPKLRKGLHARQGWDERGKSHDSRQGEL